MDMEESYSSDKVRSCSSNILTYDVRIQSKNAKSYVGLQNSLTKSYDHIYDILTLDFMV